MEEEKIRKPIITAGIVSAALVSILQLILLVGKIAGWWFILDQHQVWLATIQILIPLVIIGVATWWLLRQTKPKE